MSASETRPRSPVLGDSQPPAPVSSNLTPRSACERCRGRKSKCSGDRPVCATCQKAKVSCVYAQGSGHDSAAAQRHTKQLEERLARLEGELRQSRSMPSHSVDLAELPRGNHFPPTSPVNLARSTSSAPSLYEPGHTPNKRQRIEDHGEGSSNRPVSHYQASLNDDGGYARSSLGAGHGLPSNTQLLERLPTTLGIQSILESPAVEEEEMPERIHPVRPLNKQLLPHVDQLRHLIKHFLTYTNSAYPILHQPTLERQFHEVCVRSEGSSSNVDICIVLLVLAISATSLPRIDSTYNDLRLTATSFWKHAQLYLPTSISSKSISHLQIDHLNLQYALYNPDAGSVWDLSGAAMRTAVDMGLHHELPLGSRNRTSALDLDLRRRLFWISYSIDRNLAIALGRPPSIPDDWITVDFPSDIDDSLITTSGILPSSPSPRKTTALHLFRIRRLQSEIQNRLYRPNQGLPPPEWFESVMTQLDEWRSTFPTPTGFVSNEWLNLNYHLTTSLLYRPTPANPNPDMDGLRKALQSSGSTMRVYKEMYRKGRINYNWLAMYHLFMSGLTYLNSLWEADRRGWSIVPSLVDALLDMQGCSSIMEALAAITSGTNGIRNAFENVSEGVIRYLSMHSKVFGPSRPASPNLLRRRPLPPSQLANVEPQHRASQSANSNFSESGTQLPPRNGGDPSWQSTLSTGHQDFDMLFANDNMMMPQQLEMGNVAGVGEEVNPFDDFLFYPLGERSELEWDHAVASALQQMQPTMHSGF